MCHAQRAVVCSEPPPIPELQPGQRGFAMVELAVAALLATLLVVWGAQALMNRLSDAQARAAAVWMSVVHKAAMAYVEQHGPDIQMAAAPDALIMHGYADWRFPTLDELTRAGMLSAGTSSATGLTGAARVAVWRSGACPGDTCMVEALVYGEKPLHLRHSTTPDEAMMAQWLLAAEGKGAAVHASDPDHIRGASFRFGNALPNGVILPAGTVGMGITAEHLAKWSYLRVGDRRDPDFQGALSVQGDVYTAQGARVEGQLVIETEHLEGTLCQSDKAIVHDVAGGLLVCRNGRWRPASRGGGGGYGYNAVYGCRLRDGTPTHNPVTGNCSCPSYASAVPIFNSGPQNFPEGTQYAYLCVG